MKTRKTQRLQHQAVPACVEESVNKMLQDSSEYISKMNKYLEGTYMQYYEGIQESAKQLASNFQKIQPTLGSAAENIVHNVDEISEAAKNLEIQQQLLSYLFASSNDYSMQESKFVTRMKKDLEDMGATYSDSFQEIEKQARYNVQIVKSAIDPVIEGCSQLATSGIMKNMEFQEQYLGNLLDSSIVESAEKMVKGMTGNIEKWSHISHYQYSNMSWGEERAYILPTPHQPRMHPADADRFDRIEYLLLESNLAEKEITQVPNAIAEVSDFEFQNKGMILSYKGKPLEPLSRLGMQLCSIIFSEGVKYQFGTMDIERILYPGDNENIKPVEKLKKVVKRANAEIMETTRYSKVICVLTRLYISKKIGQIRPS